MEVFIRIEKIDDTKGRIIFKHHKPSELSEDDRLDGYIVDNVEPINETGKILTEYYLYSDNKIIYEYEDIPKTEEQNNAEKIIQLEKDKHELKLALENMAIQQEKDKLELQSAIVDAIEAMTK